MSDVIFVKTHHHYDPYQDYFKLAELSGFPIVNEDEIDPHSDHCYIVSHFVCANRPDGWPGAKARIILWQLEWDVAEAVLRTPGVAEVWTMDVHYARQIGAKYVPVGSHPGLAGYYLESGQWHEPGVCRPSTFKYDVAMLAYMVNRRQTVAFQLAQLGLSLMPSAWGFDRHCNLMLTRAMLHVHQHEKIRGVACLRWAIAAAYKLPVITETLWDGGIFCDREHMIVAEYWALAQTVSRAIADRMLEPIGEALHQLLCVERTFRRNVEAAL